MVKNLCRMVDVQEAITYGINAAHVLNQLRLWSNHSHKRTEMDGEIWFPYPQSALQRDLAWMSIATVERCISKLKKAGVIRVMRVKTGKRDPNFDQNFYSVSPQEEVKFHPENGVSSNPQCEGLTPLFSPSKCMGHDPQFEVSYRKIGKDSPSDRKDSDSLRSSQRKTLLLDPREEPHFLEGEKESPAIGIKFGDEMKKDFQTKVVNKGRKTAAEVFADLEKSATTSPEVSRPLTPQTANRFWERKVSMVFDDMQTFTSPTQKTLGQWKHILNKLEEVDIELQSVLGVILQNEFAWDNFTRYAASASGRLRMSKPQVGGLLLHIQELIHWYEKQSIESEVNFTEDVELSPQPEVKNLETPEYITPAQMTPEQRQSEIERILKRRKELQNKA